jgi:tetratricopeptide (TPR) repeat protein
MPDDPRVQQLLDELLDTDATPEEVCGSCAELLPVVRARWRQMRDAQAQLDALFPPAPEPGESLLALPSGGTPMPVVPGYEVEAVVGLGGMGVVFRARHVRLNRVVALKMPLAGGYAGPGERACLQREAEAAAALRHPNVVPLYDIGDSDGRPYFTMEYVDGGSLAQKLAGTPLLARDAAELLATLAGAVQAAHESGVVHRDLKPANVLLTSAGVPKVSDFGLATRLGGDAALTRKGVAAGTPSYMAPEQAGGRTESVGTAADIYALGAILYELLTGRPPFRAETAAETVQQVLSQDPVAPSRLNRTVPRDLETVCLKCLQKEPRLRYASASALADDLGRFLRGEAIAARPESWLHSWVRRVSRRPVLSAAIAVATLSTVALIGGGLWTYSEWDTARRAADVRQAAEDAERTAIRRAAEDDLNETLELQRSMHWHGARVALERAKGRLGGNVPPDLHTRMGQAERELELVSRCDAIRLDGYRLAADRLDFGRSDGEYEKAFRRAGLVYPDDTPAAAAARVAETPIAPVVVAALDHWAVCCFETPGRKAWLLDIVGRVDAGGASWRARAADPAVWKDEDALERLIDEAPPAYLSLPALLLIEGQTAAADRDPVPFLRRVQQKYPGDLWANMRLAKALYRSDPRDAVRYYQAALAIRPDAAVVHSNLGTALIATGRHEEAVVHYRAAAAGEPKFAYAHNNLAVTLWKLKRYDETIECVRRAAGHGVRRATMSAVLGDSLAHRGKPDEALAAFEEAVALDPLNVPAQSGLRSILIARGQFHDARAAWANALRFNPPGHDAWYGYAELCLFLSAKDDYRTARTALLERFGQTTDPTTAERTARACLLLPASDDNEFDQAVALAGRAAAVDRKTAGWFHSHYQFVRGLAEYRQGQFEKAIATLRGDAATVGGPTPRLVLAMALHKNGQEAEARKTLALVVSAYDWRLRLAVDQDGWIRHGLRREAEALMLPNLPAFLGGKHLPADNDERLGLLGVCQFENRTLTLARLYTDAFAADAMLADDFRTGRRAIAAVSAALAGCGQGEDAAGLVDAERAKWRTQAREWLRSDLAAWEKAIKADPAAHRDAARQRLRQWVNDPDLVWVRRPDLLEKLPAGERKDWAVFWSDVNAMLKSTANGS